MAPASTPSRRSPTVPIVDGQPGLAWDQLCLALGRSSGFVAWLDADGVVRKAAGRVGGTPAATWEDQPFVERVPEAHRPLVLAAIRDAFSPVLEHTLDLPLDGPGGPTWWSASISPAGDSGRPAGVVVIAAPSPARAEVERLKPGEQLLREIEQVANVGIWTWDPAQPHAWWSPQLYRIYALDPATHVPTYQDYLERVHPDDRARVQAATEHVFNDHVSYSHDERIHRPDGEERALHTWAHAVLDSDGKLLRLVGVCQDITERKQAEAELERSHRQLQVSERLASLGNLVSGVAHDVRSPLTYIGVNLEVLDDAAAKVATLDPELGAEVRKRIDAARDGATRIERLVAQLLQFARPEPVLASGAVADAVRDALVVARATQPGLSVVLDLAPDLPPALFDKPQVDQVLLNLLNNAADAMGGKGRVRVSTRRDGAMARIDVRDEGPGIPQSVQAHLFDPFFTTKRHGTGLGLSIARRIAEAHRGTLTFESEVGKGTCFTLRLPLAAST